MAAGSEAFPKSLRLRSRAEFTKVQSKGQKVSVEPLLGLYLPNGLPYSRIGLTVSSKVGNAVVRARVRRYLRECFRKRREKLPVGIDLVLIARAGAKEADMAVFTNSFDALAERLMKKVSA